MLMDSPHRVVIIGGGFGGLYAAQSLKRAALQVILIDRRNFHLCQPHETHLFLIARFVQQGMPPAKRHTLIQHRGDATVNRCIVRFESQLIPEQAGHYRQW